MMRVTSFALVLLAAAGSHVFGAASIQITSPAEQEFVNTGGGSPAPVSVTYQVVGNTCSGFRSTFAVRPYVNGVPVLCSGSGCSCDGTIESCNNISKTITLDGNDFDSCLNTIQLSLDPAPFTPVLCLTPGPAVFSTTIQVWQSPYGQCTGPEDCNRSTVGEPVDVATGKMYHEMVDLRLDGALPIELLRRYDNQATFDDVLGFGWRHAYQMGVEADGDRRVFVDERGRRNYFARNAQGVWQENLIEHLTLTAPGTPAWRVTDKHQKKYEFDGSGRLTGIVDRNGNTITLGYTGNDLTSIGDMFGRALTLAYDGSNRLQTVSAGSRTVTYAYDGSGNLERVDYPDGSFVTYEYTDPLDSHNLTVARDALTNVIEAHTYLGDGSDRVMHTESEGGNEAFDFVYDSPTQTTVTNALTLPTVYTHDAFSGLVVSSNGPGCASCGVGGSNAALTYDDFLNLTSRVDGATVQTDMAYDSRGNMSTRTEAVGAPAERTTTFTYHPTFNRVTTTTVPSVGSCANPDRVVTNTYDGATGDLLTQEVVGCDGTMPFAHTTTYGYDAHGQLAGVDGPRTDVADVTTYDYYPDADADVNRRGRLQRVTNALGRELTYDTYDLFGNVGSVIDANNVETTFLYDARDRPAETRIHGSVPADDLVTLRTYDATGNLDIVKFPECVDAGPACAFSLDHGYDGVNRLTEVQDAVGNKLIYAYDLAGNRTREEFRNSGGVVRRFVNFAYDSLNRLEYVYFNNITPPDPGSVFAKLTYDGQGNRTAYQDPEGHVTSYVYDELRQLRSRTEMVGATPLTTMYDYDTQGHVTQVTDPAGLLTTYDYGDAGTRLQQTTQDSGTIDYSYDPAGNLTSTIDARGITVTRGNDALHRVITVSYPDAGLNETHTYDDPGASFGIGRRTGIADATGSVSFDYDRAGRLVAEQRTIGGTTYTSGYDYDKNGNVTRIRYPTADAGVRQGQVDLVRNDADTVSAITAQINGAPAAVATGIQYEPFGSLANLVFGNGLVDSRGYDTRQQLGNWTVGGVIDYTHAYDDDGLLTGRTDHLDSVNDRSFGYDEVHRLIQASGPWGGGSSCPGGQTYTYDDGGNRLCKGEIATTTNYSYTAGTNRLDSSSGAEVASYSYDAAGNVLGDGSHTYEFSDAARMATIDGGVTASYVYDAGGRRTIRTASGTSRYYFYDPSGRLLTEIDPASNSGADYVYLDEAPIARIDWGLGEVNAGNVLLVTENGADVSLDWTAHPTNGNEYVVRRKQLVDPQDKTFDGSIILATPQDPTQTHDDPVLGDSNSYFYRVFRRDLKDTLLFYHPDHLGTPIAVTDDDGDVVWRAEYRPSGEIHDLPVSDVGNDLRFAGQQADGAAPLYYNGFRWYDHATTRYRRPDPLGRNGGPHPYVYVVNNPLNLVDPLGLKVELRCRKVGSPDGRLGFKVWAARNIAGATHCFLDVTCPGAGVPQTTVSYLGNGVNVVENASGGTNNDLEYSRSGRYQPYPVKPPPRCKPEQCRFERCIINMAKTLKQKDFRIQNYSVIGPNSNSFAQRMIRECGGKLGVPVGGGVDGAYGIESPWNIELPD